MPVGPRDRLAEIAAFAVALSLRLALLAALPVLPSGDSYARLAEPTTLVKAVWLPGYQAALAVVSLVAEDPFWLRAFTCLEGALAAAAGAWCARVWLGGRAAWWVGLGLALLPSFVFPSIALYQEPQFLLLILSAFALARGVGVEHPATLVAFGLACATRYEAWPLAALAGLLPGPRTPRRLLLGAFPLAWVLWWGSISPVGTASLHHTFSLWAVLTRQGILWRLAWEAGAGPVWIVAAAVLVRSLWHRPIPRVPWALALGLVGVGMALAVLDPYASADNPRELQLPLVLALLLVGWALERESRRALWAMTGVLAIGTAFAFPNQMAHQRDPAAALEFTAGTLLRDAGLRHGVFVLAPGFPEWPDAPTVDCEAIRGLTRGDVRCDFEPGAALDARTDTVVQITRFEAWRPVQKAALAELADAARWEPVLLSPFALWRRVGAPPLSTASLSALRQRFGVPSDCEGPVDAVLPARLALEGKAVVVEPGRLAFYTAGSATFPAPASGVLRIRACGTLASGRGPRLRVETDGSFVEATATDLYGTLTLGPVTAGSPIHIRYDDDFIDAAGNDRNLFISTISVGP